MARLRRVFGMDAHGVRTAEAILAKERGPELEGDLSGRRIPRDDGDPLAW